MAAATTATNSTYNVREGQSVYDLALQLYGSIDFIFKLIQDNIGIQNLDVLGLGAFQVTFDPSLITDQSVANRNSADAIIYITGNNTLPAGGLDTDDAEPIQTDDGEFIVISG